MKIRNDFVSNSSSVSYIITMKKEMVELFGRMYADSEKNELDKVREVLKDDLLENGTRAYIEGEEMYIKKYKFATDGDINTREYMAHDGKEVDVAVMSDQELWAYIYGEYIMKGEIGKIVGFGSTQVETY
ncbi:hypothetical protein [Pedobacter chitinilyticus]|uniref:Uncharacterized protein n=1 Tax=Pedobacter chitinilyticus TaxID=2233776 RepID=A0A3S3Q1A9_9SPHI|nr:hypothetical protein [Pedobacter chitinilyticus]RWU10653.1 hypothetical protein DPV69_04755 [Pedobacter chitinilyticus]